MNWEAVRRLLGTSFKLVNRYVLTCREEKKGNMEPEVFPNISLTLQEHVLRAYPTSHRETSRIVTFRYNCPTQAGVSIYFPHLSTQSLYPFVPIPIHNYLSPFLFSLDFCVFTTTFAAFTTLLSVRCDRYSTEY